MLQGFQYSIIYNNLLFPASVTQVFWLSLLVLTVYSLSLAQCLLYKPPRRPCGLRTDGLSMRLLLTFLFFLVCVWPQKLLNIIAGVLHLGNTQFGESEEGETYITTETQITNLVKVRKVPLVLLAVQICKKGSHMKALNRCVVVFQLLGVDGSALTEALTHKKLTAKGEEVTRFPVCLSFSAVW